jgi:hypothetical protein
MVGLRIIIVVIKLDSRHIYARIWISLLNSFLDRITWPRDLYKEKPNKAKNGRYLNQSNTMPKEAYTMMVTRVGLREDEKVQLRFLSQIDKVRNGL